MQTSELRGSSRQLSGNPMGNRRFVVVGRPGEGKSFWIKNYLIPQYDYVLVVDPLHEYRQTNQCDVWQVENRSAPQAEVEKVIDDFLLKPYEMKKQGRNVKLYEIVVFEEASRYAPSRTPLPPKMATLNDVARHMDLDLAFCARRFSQLHTDLTELASTTVIYNQTGVNDLQRCDELISGLSEEVKRLPKYHYIQVERGEYRVMPPVADKGFK